jgi:hypothetical protein
MIYVEKTHHVRITSLGTRGFSISTLGFKGYIGYIGYMFAPRQKYEQLNVRWLSRWGPQGLQGPTNRHGYY